MKHTGRGFVPGVTPGVPFTMAAWRNGEDDRFYRFRCEILTPGQFLVEVVAKRQNGVKRYPCWVNVYSPGNVDLEQSQEIVVFGSHFDVLLHRTNAATVGGNFLYEFEEVSSFDSRLIALPVCSWEVAAGDLAVKTNPTGLFRPGARFSPDSEGIVWEFQSNTLVAGLATVTPYMLPNGPFGLGAGRRILAPQSYDAAGLQLTWLPTQYSINLGDQETIWSHKLPTSIGSFALAGLQITTANMPPADAWTLHASQLVQCP